MNEELKPCPFCGNTPSLMKSDKGSDIYYTTDGCYMEPGTSKMEIIEHEGKKYIKVDSDCSACTGCAFEHESEICTAPEELECTDMLITWIFQEIKDE